MEQPGVKGGASCAHALKRKLPPAGALASLGFVLLCFGKPLYELFLLAAGSPVYSYILIIPLAAGYLLCVPPTKLVWNRTPKLIPALIPSSLGVTILAGYFWAVRSGWKPVLDDRLAAMTLSMVCFAYAVAVAYLHGSPSRGVVFPLGLLVFMAPFPSAVFAGIEFFLQHRSADAAQVFFSISGVPFIREDTFFRLPGISLLVAPECSGVRSTLALFITSLIAAHLLLRSPWHKAILVAFVIPLAIVRNAFRIFTIGQLCIQVGPHMIESPIHHKGGPIFFALSLVPFLLLLLFLRRRERLKSSAGDASEPGRPATVES